MANYAKSAELELLGKAIISNNFPHLEPVSIAWVFRDEAELKNGRIEEGHTYRESAREWTMHGFDFTICMAKDIWLKTSDDFRYAMLDHQISFIGLRYREDPSEPGKTIPELEPRTGRLATFVRTPDVREFTDVMVRHGAYYGELRSFLVAFAERRKLQKEEARKAAKRAASKETTGEVDLGPDDEASELEREHADDAAPGGLQGARG